MLFAVESWGFWARIRMACSVSVGAAAPVGVRAVNSVLQLLAVPPATPPVELTHDERMLARALMRAEGV